MRPFWSCLFFYYTLAHLLLHKEEMHTRIYFTATGGEKSIAIKAIKLSGTKLNEVTHTGRELK